MTEVKIIFANNDLRIYLTETAERKLAWIHYIAFNGIMYTRDNKCDELTVKNLTETIMDTEIIRNGQVEDVTIWDISQYYKGLMILVYNIFSKNPNVADIFELVQFYPYDHRAIMDNDIPANFRYEFISKDIPIQAKNIYNICQICGKMSIGSHEVHTYLINTDGNSGLARSVLMFDSCDDYNEYIRAIKKYHSNEIIKKYSCVKLNYEIINIRKLISQRQCKYCGFIMPADIECYNCNSGTKYYINNEIIMKALDTMSKRKELMFGAEIEIESPYVERAKMMRKNIISNIVKYDKKLVFSIVSDGSLNSGCEFKLVPKNYNYFASERFKKIYDIFNKYGLFVETCGCHISVDARIFTSPMNAVINGIFNYLYRNCKNLFLEYLNRDEEKLRRYADIVWFEGFNNLTSFLRYTCSEKYVTISTRDYQRTEFRLFGGTANYYHFLSFIELIKSVYDFYNKNLIEDTSFYSFINDYFENGWRDREEALTFENEVFRNYFDFAKENRNKYVNLYRYLISIVEDVFNLSIAEI